VLAAEPADLAFHAALLVRPADAGDAVERVEAVFPELAMIINSEVVRS
jgi:hypothetical protein